MPADWSTLDDEQILLAFLMGEGGDGNGQQYASILDTAQNRTTDPWFRRTYGSTLRDQLLARQTWNGSNRAEFDIFSPGLAGARSDAVFNQVRRGSADPNSLTAAERRQWNTAQAALAAYRRGEGVGSARGATFYATPGTSAARQAPRDASMAFDDGQHKFWKTEGGKFRPLLPGSGPSVPQPPARPPEFGRAPAEADLSLYGKTFNPDFYRTENPDVAAAGVDPWTHFRQSGYAEGRRANPFFDQELYLRENADVAAAGIDPLRHYAESGRFEGRRASALFNEQDYLEANPDLVVAGIGTRGNPMGALTHFLQHGIGERRGGVDLSTMPGFNPADPWGSIAAMGASVDGPWSQPAPPPPPPAAPGPGAGYAPGYDPPAAPGGYPISPFVNPADASNPALYNPAAAASAPMAPFDPSFGGTVDIFNMYPGNPGIGWNPPGQQFQPFGGYPIGPGGTPTPYGGAYGGGGGPGPMVIDVHPSGSY